MIEIVMEGHFDGEDRAKNPFPLAGGQHRGHWPLRSTRSRIPDSKGVSGLERRITAGVHRCGRRGDTWLPRWSCSGRHLARDARSASTGTRRLRLSRRGSDRTTGSTTGRGICCADGQSPGQPDHISHRYRYGLRGISITCSSALDVLQSGIMKGIGEVLSFHWRSRRFDSANNRLGKSKMKGQELVTRYRQGERYFPRIDLGQAVLAEAYLIGAILRGAQGQ